MSETWKELCTGWCHDENNIKGFFGEYRYLSNFHLSDLCLNGIIYPSSENAYQSFKVIEQDRLQFSSVSPSESKKIWKHLRLKYNGSKWDNEIKYNVMFFVLMCKFTQNEDLKEKLIKTRDKYLEETNWWQDYYWGVCYNMGDNNLGKQLMFIREILQ